MSEEIEWTNMRSRFSPPPKREPAIDKVVSDIVGKPIKVTDSRLIKLVAKWKAEENKADNDNTISNYFEDPKKVAELKETL